MAKSIEDIEPFIQEAVSEDNPPGVSLAVIKGNELRYAKGFGAVDSKQQQQTTIDTVYQWWSLTKLFTVVAVLQLQERGQLSINDPVSKRLNRFNPTGKYDSDSVTIKQLLSHSSGLGDIGMRILGMIHFDDDPKPVQSSLYDKIAPKYSKLKYQPGKEGRYSNFGYFTLAVLIEEVSGLSYEEYVTRNILIPLGMDRTGFVYTENMRSDVATGSHPRDAISLIVPFYLDTKRAVNERRDGILWFNEVYSDIKGSSGLIGPATDLVKFLGIFVNENRTLETPVLTEESIILMQNPVVNVKQSPAAIDNLEFGLGWFIGSKDGKQSLYHGGNGMAFVSMINVIPEENIAIAVLSNSTYLGRTMGFKLIDLLSEVDW